MSGCVSCGNVVEVGSVWCRECYTAQPTASEVPQTAEPEPPADPFTAMATAAMQMHHLFCSFVEGGFTEWQALRLVAMVVTEANRSGDQ